MIKHISKAIYLLILLLVGQVAVGQIQDTTVVERNGRKFYLHVVEAGNTLYSISKQRHLSVAEIEQHNPGVGAGLNIGDTLYILAVDRDKVAKEMKMEVDGNILVHEVQKGQTLYAIAKMYELNVNDLIEENPIIKEGLKPGQLIRIPIAKLKKQEEIVAADSNDKKQLHRVDSGETLYGLSKKYQVEIEQIKNANNGLPEGLKLGMELVIPSALLAQTFPEDSTIMKDRYQVAFILPLFLDLNDTLKAHQKINEKEEVHPKSLVAIQFYHGCLMALDSLRTLGFKFDVKIFDSAKDSSLIDRLIENGSLKGMDLIIGPFYQSQFIRLSEYVKQEKIHVVSPVPQNNRILLGNGYVSKVATSKNVMFTKLADLLFYQYRSENILVITQLFRANVLAHSFMDHYDQLLELKNDSTLQVPKEVKWDNGSIDLIKAQLIDSVFNIIVVPSHDQAYVTELLSQLNRIREDYMFKIIGTEDWQKYSNIDFAYFDHLNVMIPVDGFVDFNKPSTISFAHRYSERFKIFPEKYAFIGFDVSFYYLSTLHQYGNRLETGLLKEKQTLYYYGFDFFKTGIESGYENSNVRLLKYSDFEVSEVLKPE